MAPPSTTDDFYKILEVEQDASVELIVRSNKRLALQLHPDKNSGHNATQGFQRLSSAYETLRDENKRREYDLMYPRYPSISRKHPSNSRQAPSPSPANSRTRPSPAPPQTEKQSEEAQIAALEKVMRDRAAQWQVKRRTMVSPIIELQRVIQGLERDIRDSEAIDATELAEEQQKDSWSSWLLSSVYKPVEESEEEKERKRKRKQERRAEKDRMKKRLVDRKVDVRGQVDSFNRARERFEAADRADRERIAAIQNEHKTREAKEEQYTLKKEQERLTKMWNEQQKRREGQQRERMQQQRERIEVIQKERTDKLAADRKQLKEALNRVNKRQQDINEAARRLWRPD